MAATEHPSVPSEIARALGTLSTLFSVAGYVVAEVVTSESFGNFAVTFVGPRGSIQLVRDRGQVIVSGPPRAQLESAGLWRAFAGVRDLESPLKAWLGTASEA